MPLLGRAGGEGEERGKKPRLGKFTLKIDITQILKTSSFCDESHHYGLKMFACSSWPIDTVVKMHGSLTTMFVSCCNAPRL